MPDRRRSALCLGLLIAALALGACGSGAKRAPAALTGASTSAVASTTGSSTSAPVSTTGSSTTAPSSATAPSATTPQPSSGGTPAAPVQAHAEVPAIFSVLSNGSLSPRTVSAPASLPIELTVVSHDGRRHTVVLRIPSPHGLTVHGLTVPAGGRASVLLSGLRPGRYALELDGNNRGVLVVGVGPGP